MKWMTSIPALTVSLLLSACVGPQEMTLVEREQRSLRTENSQLRKDLDGVRAQLADSRASIQEMQSQLNALRGWSDEMRHQIDRQLGESSQQREQKVVDLEDRIVRIDDELRAQGTLLKAREQELQVLRKAVLRATGVGSELATLTRRNPTESRSMPTPERADPARVDYEQARKTLDNKDYRNAIIRFKEFIVKHPKSDYADNAQYWIGESHYALKQFDQAILEFDAVRRKYSSGDKVPAALLKQGFAFAELGDKGDARLILQELIALYPQSQEAVLAQQKVKTLES